MYVYLYIQIQQYFLQFGIVLDVDSQDSLVKSSLVKKRLNKKVTENNSFSLSKESPYLPEKFMLKLFKTHIYNRSFLAFLYTRFLKIYNFQFRVSQCA